MQTWCLLRHDKEWMTLWMTSNMFPVMDHQGGNVLQGINVDYMSVWTCEVFPCCLGRWLGTYQADITTWNKFKGVGSLAEEYYVDWIMFATKTYIALSRTSSITWQMQMITRTCIHCWDITWHSKNLFLQICKIIELWTCNEHWSKLT